MKYPCYYGENAYTFSQNMITVTIPFNKPKKIKNDTENDTENEVENEVEKLLIQFIQENAFISKAKMAEKIEKSVSTVERVLKKSKIIVRVGGAKGGY